MNYLYYFCACLVAGFHLVRFLREPLPLDLESLWDNIIFACSLVAAWGLLP